MNYRNPGGKVAVSFAVVLDIQFVPTALIGTGVLPDWVIGDLSRCVVVFIE